MLCVLGVLKNKKGLSIKKEMLSWLNPLHDVLCIEQDPPGKLFEYPAIYYTLKLAVDMNEPVLYLHTKGAANEAWYQVPVRNMWKNEFGTSNINEYLNFVNTNEPAVATPISGDKGMTVFNGFIINPAAAELLLKTFHKSNNRFYFENLFDNKIFKVQGMIKHNATHDELQNMQRARKLFIRN